MDSLPDIITKLNRPGYCILMGVGIFTNYFLTPQLSSVFGWGFIPVVLPDFFWYSFSGLMGLYIHNRTAERKEAIKAGNG